MFSLKFKHMVSICFFITQPLHAEILIETSGKLLRFNYEEFSVDGSSFNKETGYLPGISISASQKTKPSSTFNNKIELEIFDGQVDYDGQTQLGIPLTTDTNETVYKLHYTITYSPANKIGSVYSKLSWQSWERDILPTNITSGLFERYQWWAVELGFSNEIYRDSINSTYFSLGISNIFNGDIVVDLTNLGFNKPRLKLGDSSGVSASLSHQYKISKNESLGLSLNIQRFRFGRSNTKTISNNFIAFNITEPRSVSIHDSISLDYYYHY